MSNAPVIFTHAEWLAMRSAYSELKHSMNNALAVFSALSELAQRNPDNYIKLTKSIATRTPELVALMQEFTQVLDSKGPPPPLPVDEG